ncbi:MaoC family dehydratase [Actimicrobium antarcticum]|uniref:MaoC family dehydratase n=1 Tax=Actimicrobium antarcticum TaxID=1051899 RepID=A0ABP7SX28_9BURK
MAQPAVCFEDFVIGQRFDAGSVTVDGDEVLAFATRFDPQPFHIDQQAAEKSIFGGLIASGWHTCSMMMRLMVDGYLRDSSSMGSPGIDDIRWLKPVRVGDVLRVSSTVLDIVPSTSRPDRGVVMTLWEAYNQKDELVATIKGRGLFLRRAQ